MLAAFLHLSPAARDLLRFAAGSCGAPPFQVAQLAGALQRADVAQCEGLLCDASLRTDLATQVASKGGALDAAGLVGALEAVVQKRLEAIKAKAAPISKALPKGSTMPGFDDVVALLPKGEEAGETLKLDFLLWHAVGSNYDPKTIPALENGLLRERLGLAACAGGGPVAECAIAVHSLENAEAYIEYERSLAGSQPPAKSSEVLAPFDEAMCREVAVRRVLSTALPMEVAVKVATEVCGGGKKAADVLKKLTEGAKAETAVIAASMGAASAGSGGPAAQKSGFAAMHEATETHELQWHLLAYHLLPHTSLKAAAGGGAAGASGVASKAGAAGGPPAGGGPAPKGFAGIWATGASPIGQGFKEDFSCTWRPVAGSVPPGHTEYSWVF